MGTPALPSSTPVANSRIDLNSIRQKLSDRTNLSELRTLCFTMRVNYENYPSLHSDFIRELLRDMERQGRLDDLMAAIRRELPHVLR
jgi:hypothetical protein